MSGDFLDWCRTRATDAHALLEELVQVDSGPGQPAGFEAVIDIARRELNALGLGTEVREVAPGFPVTLGRTGTAPGGLLLLAHLDTVFPSGTSVQRPFRIADGRAHGPGVADMKGGFVGMLLALQCLHDHGHLEGIPMSVLVNCDEEIGSVHSRSLIETEARNSRAVLCFEPARPDGSLVTRRRGHRRFRVEVQGRAAHTGVNPEAGANAIVTLANWVAALEEHRAAFPDGTSVTVSLIEGGTSINTVPAHASASVDVRVPDPEAADAAESLLRSLRFVSIPGTSVEMAQFAGRPPMTEIQGVAELLDMIELAARDLDLSISFTATGGSSDAGITTNVGVPSVDCLGPVGGGYHTDEEFLILATLPERAALAAETIRRWSERKL